MQTPTPVLTHLKSLGIYVSFFLAISQIAVVYYEKVNLSSLLYKHKAIG